MNFAKTDPTDIPAILGIQHVLLMHLYARCEAETANVFFDFHDHKKMALQAAENLDQNLGSGAATRIAKAFFENVHEIRASLPRDAPE